MNLFEQKIENDSDAPLAYRMRPRGLDDYSGQGHLVGLGAPLRRIIEEDRLHSFVLYGPPGSG
ncbi:MAG: replication-associated recombination protein A, partial [Candidatus Saccharibacteria bacterium]